MHTVVTIPRGLSSVAYDASERRGLAHMDWCPDNEADMLPFWRLEPDHAALWILFF
jgi:hypothetical protein